VELGRRDRIIPVIVEGKPYSGDPATECYNPSLIKHFPHSDNIADDREILGVNIHEEGKGSAYMKRERAVIQIVSRMLDVNYDQLWNRQRRRIITRTVVSTLLSIVFVCTLALTWFYNQPFTSQVKLAESSVHNANLPVLQDAVVTLSLGNETKTDTLKSIDESGIFRNLPARMKGKEVRLIVTAQDWLTTDTTLVLTENIQLLIARNPKVYGHVALTVLQDGKLLENTPLQLAGHLVKTDKNGRLEMDLPLSEQSTEYPLINPANGKATMVFPPFGPNDAAEL
jgi:hypothetical protein